MEPRGSPGVSVQLNRDGGVPWEPRNPKIPILSVHKSNLLLVLVLLMLRLINIHQLIWVDLGEKLVLPLESPNYGAMLM